MMGILSILAWHFSVGRMCKPIIPHLFQYLANRGGQACSKRGASVCSNCQSVPLVSIFGNRVNSTLLFQRFFQRFHAMKIHFLPKAPKHCTPSLHQQHQKKQRTMMRNNNNININNDRVLMKQSTRGRAPLPSVRVDSFVSNREGEGRRHEKGRSVSVFLVDGLSTHLEDHRPSQKATTTRLSIPLSTTSYSFH